MSLLYDAGDLERITFNLSVSQFIILGSNGPVAALVKLDTV